MSDDKIFDKNDIDIVIYHYPCKDGFGSAYVVWKYYFEKDKEIVFHPAQHGSLPPDVTNKNVLLCDFSYSKEVMEQLKEDSNSIFVIDHHKSSIDTLKDFEEKILDMNHSGCILTWKYFYGDSESKEKEEAPLFLRYIEDRDIWKWEMENSKEFSSWFALVENEFDVYDNICENENEIIEGINIGKSFLQLENHYIERIAKRAIPKLIRIGDKYLIAAHVNSNLFKSEVGNKIFDIYPFIDLSVVYSLKSSSNMTLFSLRSTNYHADASEIAKMIGGGGHRNASGAAIPSITNCISSKIYQNVYEPFSIYEKNGIVYLNSNNPVIGKYLIQEKYNGINNASNIMSLMNFRDDDNKIIIDWHNEDDINKYKENIKKYDTVILWHFDGQNVHYMVFNENNDYEKYRDYEKYNDYDEKDGYIKYTTEEFP